MGGPVCEGPLASSSSSAEDDAAALVAPRGGAAEVESCPAAKRRAWLRGAALGAYALALVCLAVASAARVVGRRGPPQGGSLVSLLLPRALPGSPSDQDYAPPPPPGEEFAHKWLFPIDESDIVGFAVTTVALVVVAGARHSCCLAARDGGAFLGSALPLPPLPPFRGARAAQFPRAPAAPGATADAPRHASPANPPPLARIFRNPRHRHWRRLHPHSHLHLHLPLRAARGRPAFQRRHLRRCAPAPPLASSARAARPAIVPRHTSGLALKFFSTPGLRPLPRNACRLHHAFPNQHAEAPPAGQGPPGGAFLPLPPPLPLRWAGGPLVRGLAKSPSSPVNPEPRRPIVDLPWTSHTTLNPSPHPGIDRIERLAS